MLRHSSVYEDRGGGDGNGWESSKSEECIRKRKERKECNSKGNERKEEEIDTRTELLLTYLNEAPDQEEICRAQLVRFVEKDSNSAAMKRCCTNLLRARNAAHRLRLLKRIQLPSRKQSTSRELVAW